MTSDENPVAVFRGANAFDAHAACCAVEAAGIPAEVVGDTLDFARGEIPFGVATDPAVVVRASDETACAEILADLRAAHPEAEPVSEEEQKAYGRLTRMKRVAAWSLFGTWFLLPLPLMTMRDAGWDGSYGPMIAAVLLAAAVVVPAGFVLFFYSRKGWPAAYEFADADEPEADLWTSRPEIGRTVFGAVGLFAVLAAWTNLTEGRVRGVGLLMGAVLALVLTVWWDRIVRERRG